MSKFLTVIKDHGLRLLFSFIILFFFIMHVTETIEWSFIHALENQAYDIRLELTLPDKQDNRIVIIDIDEKSLSEIGRWPWNRSAIARLIDQLFDTYHIDVFGMDVVFVEPDDSSGLKKLQALAQGPLKKAPAFLERVKRLEKVLDYDSLLAQSLKSRRIALGYAFTTTAEGTQDIEAGQLPSPIFTDEQIQGYNLNYMKAQGFAANLPQFQANAMTAGHFNFVPDPDGIMRRLPILYGYKGQLYQSLSLAVAQAALKIPQIQLGLVTTKSGTHHLKFLQLGNRKIPVDKQLQILIPFQGKRNHFPSLSASDILYERIKNPEQLKGKIVLLGTTAQGLEDTYATSVEESYPSVEVHANIIAGILDKTIMDKPNYIKGMEVSLLILIGVVMIIVLPLLNPLLATLSTLIVLGLVFWLNVIIWTQMQFVLPLATTFFLILSLFIFNMSYGYFIEFKNKRHLTHLFGQYIPPELVKEMSQHLGSEFSMEGESREMTVLFSDVRGFTTISEGLEPKALSQLMNEYLTPMTRIIHEHRGTIDKYMGDAIMAFWGAPLHEPQHASYALEASMKMLDYLEKMSLQLKAKGWPQLEIGIGLNTGIMSIGNMGSQFRIAYTALGDAVNLGSRLEGLTKQYGVPIIVSETTKSAAPVYLNRELDDVRVKGREQPVAIFEPIGQRDKVDDSIMIELSVYEKALENYRQQHWKTAKVQFAQLQAQHPNCLLYKFYAERIKHFMENTPSDNWDGVYAFTTK